MDFDVSMLKGPTDPRSATPSAADAQAVARDAAPKVVALFQWTHGLINRLMMLADAACIFLGITFAGSWIELTASQSIVIAALATGSFQTVLRRAGAYRVERYRRPFHVAVDLSLGLGIASLLCMIVLMVFRTDLPQIHWLGAWALMLLLLGMERLLAAYIVGLVQEAGKLRVKVAVIGDNMLGQDLLRRMSSSSLTLQYEVIGLFDDNLPDMPKSDLSSQDVFAAVDPRSGIRGSVRFLGVYAETNAIDLIVVCLPALSAEIRQRVIEQVQWIAADVVVPIATTDGALANARVAQVAGVQSLQIMHRPFKGTQGLLKIAEDYVIAVAALLLLSPIMILSAIAIRIDSPGPILFRQLRTGFNNKPFMITKFRSMTVDPTDDGSVGTLKRDDPRITRVGRILRGTSIDELPQLLNVLRGEMSIVGPRPYVPNMLVGSTRFTDTVRQYAARHRIKPGITGWAQTHGLRGNALRDTENARRSVELDIDYIANWSLWFDLRIMARTVLVVAGRNVF